MNIKYATCRYLSQQMYLKYTVQHIFIQNPIATLLNSDPRYRIIGIDTQKYSKRYYNTRV